MSKIIPDPVIVIPGITATYLLNYYPIAPETLWSVLAQKVDKRHFDQLALHPNNLEYEAQQPSLIRTGQIYEVAYRDLIEELRAELAPDAFGEAAVYPFSYDWRMPLDTLVDRLSDFIDEVVDRTSLDRRYVEAGYGRRVNLVGHSMGGLLIAGVVARGEKSARRVNRVVTMATPFQGSFEPVLKITTGLDELTPDPPKARERHAARLTPALYHLLPWSPNPLGAQALDAPDGVPGDFFDRAAWQPSVERTIKNFIDKTSVRRISPSRLFTRLLGKAQSYLKNNIHQLNLEDVGFDSSRWLCIVGVDAKTRVRMTAKLRNGNVHFDLTRKDKLNNWKSNYSRDRWVETGDGTVHFFGALPPFLDPACIVCVTPDDYGTWEFKDRALTLASGFHGILPNMNMLHRMLTRFFQAEPQTVPVAPDFIWGRPAPGVAEEQWSPPFRNLRRKKD